MTSNSPGGRSRVVRSVRSTSPVPHPVSTVRVEPAAGPSGPVTPAPSRRSEASLTPAARHTSELVERLREQWTRAGADIATRLRPGVDDARLDLVERQLGLLLPGGARAWWRLVDGVDPVRTRYRTWAPTVGPGGWVPLSLADAVRRATGRGPGLGAPPGLLPVFARDEELIAVRLGSTASQVEQLILSDDGDGYQHSWRIELDLLLATWAGSLFAAVHWLPDAHDWVTDPFAVQALPNAYLLD